MHSTSANHRGGPLAFRAYGLTVSSSIDLPELIPSATPAKADLTIVHGSEPALEPLTSRDSDPALRISKGYFCFEAPGIARFRIEGGERITVEPAPDADPTSIRLYLLGTALGAALMQRELLVLHGNAIRIGNDCLICLGPSGVGKSTLAAGFMARGHEILADDVVAIDASGAVLPGIPRIKLWRDATTSLAMETEGFDRVFPGVEKFNVPISESFNETPARARWGYILEPSDDDHFEVERITGMAMYPPLFANTYRAHLVAGLGLKPAHLEQCGRLAAQIRLSRIRRPKMGFDLDGLIQRLLADIETDEVTRRSAAP